MVTKDELLARAKEGRVKAITVDGIPLHVRRFTFEERSQILGAMASGKPLAPHDVLAKGMCDESGAPFFTADEAKQFADDNSDIADRILGRVLRHNALTPAALKKAVEDAEKN